MGGLIKEGNWLFSDQMETQDRINIYPKMFKIAAYQIKKIIHVQFLRITELF